MMIIVRHLSMVILFLGISSLSPLFSTADPKTVENGILDLRALAPSDKFSVEMNGEWEFYYGRFISPGQIACDSTLKPDLYGKVPAFWTYYRKDGKRLSGFGYATYRTIILLPEGFHQRMGLDIPVFDTSYRIYVNGDTVAGNGIPGRAPLETKPQYNPRLVSYVPDSDTLEIIIHVSNFYLRRGGFWLPMKIGSFSKIQSGFSLNWFIFICISGILFAAFIFFLVFFILDRRNPKLLMFSLVTLTLSIRPYLSSPYLITITGMSNWNIQIRFDYLNLFILMAAGLWLIYYMYPTAALRRSAVIFDLIFMAGLPVIFFAPTYIISYSDILINSLAPIIFVYAAVMSFKGVLKKRWNDLIYFVAIICMGIGIIADIITATAHSESRQTYILSSLMMVFVFVQSYFIMREWINSNHEKEKLHKQLEEINRTLEARVDERTHELQLRNDEIKEQNNKIALQNQKLSETIKLKNKIFSVISHDLRSPVVSILYTLNMLREEKFRDKIQILANSSIQYSQMVINLLENMLVWGRGQEDMIRYVPAEYDLTDIILTNMSILKESADRKAITLNFTQMGRSKGWFDKDLIDIVIRNILSNAIKYTEKGGKVSVHLREWQERAEGLVIKICDNGIGIPEDRLKRLFTGEEIESTPGTELERGTGIGLRLVNELVTISKGTISVESSPGNGSCFTVILPGKSTTDYL